MQIALGRLVLIRHRRGEFLAFNGKHNVPEGIEGESQFVNFYLFHGTE